MNTCLDVETLVESAAPQLSEMAKVAASFQDPTTLEACQTFGHQVSMLEGTLKQTFRAATLIAKKGDKLEEIANVWRRMRHFCDTVLVTLATLKERYPDCGTPELYDAALDFKQACEDRLGEIEEEVQCQKIELPKGLLPEPS